MDRLMQTYTTDEIVQMGYGVTACPFCGSLQVKASIWHYPDLPGEDRAIVSCAAERCSATRGFVYGDLEQAVADWNQRVSVPAVAIHPFWERG